MLACCSRSIAKTSFLQHRITSFSNNHTMVSNKRKASEELNHEKSFKKPTAAKDMIRNAGMSPDRSMTVDNC